MLSSSTRSVQSHEVAAKARYNMVEGQIRPNRVNDERLLAALSDVPRELFVPPALAGVAYVDEALPVAPGRYMMEPLFLARLLQEAAVAATDTALVIGASTGYSAAILARLAATVTLLESDTTLAEQARANLTGLHIANFAIQTGPMEAGCPNGGPYDVILIEGAIAEPPDAIARQLAPGGRLVAIKSQEGRSGSGMLYRKLGERISGRVLFDAVGPYLPGFEPQPVFSL